MGIATVKSGENPLTLNAIICDLNMPKMSGMEAISHFCSQFSSCLIIVMTGAGTVEKVPALVKQGVVEFLVKPINQAQLLAP